MHANKLSNCVHSASTQNNTDTLPKDCKTIYFKKSVWINTYELDAKQKSQNTKVTGYSNDDKGLCKHVQ